MFQVTPQLIFLCFLIAISIFSSYLCPPVDDSLEHRKLECFTDLAEIPTLVQHKIAKLKPGASYNVLNIQKWSYNGGATKISQYRAYSVLVDSATFAVLTKVKNSGIDLGKCLIKRTKAINDYWIRNDNVKDARLHQESASRLVLEMSALVDCLETCYTYQMPIDKNFGTCRADYPQNIIKLTNWQKHD